MNTTKNLKIIIFLIILIIIRCKSYYQYLFTFYNFTLHDTPKIFINESYLLEEIKYYNEIRKQSVIHVSISTITTLALITTFPIVIPISIGYLSYYTYVLEKSSHIEQKCKFLINKDGDDRFIIYDKIYKNNKYLKYLKIPSFFFEPLTFFIFIYIYIFGYFLYNKINIKKIIIFFLILILIFYTFSFLETLKSSNEKLQIKRDLIKRELIWTCHIKTMGFVEKIKKYLFSFFGIQTDELGYLVNDRKCKDLEIELYSIDETFIDILYKTFTRSIITIIKEILNSLETIDKIILILLTIIYFLIRPDKYVKSLLSKKKK